MNIMKNVKTAASPRTLLAVIALSTALAAGVASADGGRMKGGLLDGGLFRTERLAQKLELDATQRTRLEALLTESRGAARPHVQTLMSTRESMRELMRAEGFDEDAVRAAALERAEAQAELAVIRARVNHSVRGMLNPEQLARFDEMRRRGKHGHRGEKDESRGRHGKDGHGSGRVKG